MQHLLKSIKSYGKIKSGVTLSRIRHWGEDGRQAGCNTVILVDLSEKLTMRHKIEGDKGVSRRDTEEERTAMARGSKARAFLVCLASSPKGSVAKEAERDLEGLCEDLGSK